MPPDNLLATHLEAIGWSARELARRLECHRNLPVEWLAGRTAVPDAVAAWVAALAAHVAATPPPDWRTRVATVQGPELRAARAHDEG